MKKILLTLLLLITCFVNSYAYDACIDGIYYNLLSKAKKADVTSGDDKYSGSVIIPETVKYDGVEYNVGSIESLAFFGCTGLTSVTIGDSVKSIGSEAFYDCSSLTSVTIGNSVTSIGWRTFNGCSSLKEITIPNSMTSIGDDAFRDCSNIEYVTISFKDNDDFANYLGRDDIYSIFLSGNLSAEVHQLSVKGKILTSVIIPNDVSKIGGYAFCLCKGITSVYIPNSVNSIGAYSFGSCTALTSVTIGDSVTSIGNEAFHGCIGLTSITIPNSVTKIGDYTFVGCKGLKSILIGNSVTSIGSSAFSECCGLKSVTIPNSVISIGFRAFMNCTDLASVTIPNSIKTFNKEIFENCKNLENVYCYLEKVPTISSNVFLNAYVEYAKLHVPQVSLELYKKADVWNNFGSIVALSDEDPKPDIELSKCNIPEMIYVNGKISATSSTEGSICHISWKISSSGDGTDSVIPSSKITVSAYATAEGYKQSETVTETFILTSGGGSEDINGDGSVDSQDVLKVYEYMKNH